MRIIFLGTPDFAVPTLNSLLLRPDVHVVAVLCQPDRPAGRGNKLHVPPNKVLALANGIPVFQPERLSKDPECVESMRVLAPELIITVAFGQILKKAVLTMAPHGVINVHASLLPAYRGAAPINWCLINGEEVTGVTTMVTEAGVDTGPMLLKQKVPVTPEMNAEELAAILSNVGADLMMRTLDDLQAGKLNPEPQDDSKASHAPMLTREVGALDWELPARQLHNLVRGLVPWPAAHGRLGETTVKFLKTCHVSDAQFQSSPRKPGTVLLEGDHVLVSCGAEGGELLELLEVQPASKARMSARAWANGLRMKSGEVAFERA